MKKLFVVSDVHSFYNQLIKVLNEKGFDKNNPDHWFVSCGDLLDRGPESQQCLKFVNSLERKILIRGNHEDLMEEAINRGVFYSQDMSNGTSSSVYQLTGIYPDTLCSNKEINQLALSLMKDNILWNTYIKQCVNYYEIGNYIFVHGWIPTTTSTLRSLNIRESYNPRWRESSIEDWNSARWLNGMSMWDKCIIEPEKTIVCGHWHSSWGHSKLHNKGPQFNTDKETACFDPFIDRGIIALDGCTAYSSQVNCIVIDIDEEN